MTRCIVSEREGGKPTRKCETEIREQKEYTHVHWMRRRTLDKGTKCV